MKSVAWREMLPSDVDSVELIASQVHPGLYEERAVFAERQRLFPKGARLLEIDRQPCGYLISHPWWPEAIPALNSLLVELPRSVIQRTTYYIHDLALLTAAQGIGAARNVVAQMAADAAAWGFDSMSLVAVNGSRSFWEKQGFRRVVLHHLSAKLSAYEASAAFMIKSLRD
ncbi:GNAT family N-acetyltransferase [Propionivibrio limicola]|uniref:GNAT family N-acetyltransferase n=1 Tax=Propionivibrio limicola TaxID=167645 RepID=UPI001291FA24|nr:GNAT family N-acetyltransferase [Propionivibrio limicola]